MAKAAVSLSGRDILDLSSLSVEEYDLIMKTAADQEGAFPQGKIHC